MIEPTCGPSEHQEQPHELRVSDWELDHAARIFRALSDLPRLRLVGLLAQGRACVTALAEAESESISTISQRLRVLRSEHIVTRHRRGKHVEYVLADQHVMALISNVLAHAAETPKAIESNKTANEV